MRPHEASSASLDWTLEGGGAALLAGCHARTRTETCTLLRDRVDGAENLELSREQARHGGINMLLARNLFNIGRCSREGARFLRAAYGDRWDQSRAVLSARANASSPPPSLEKRLRSSFALAAACSLQASLGPAPSLHLYVANNLEQSRGGSHSAPLSTAVHPSFGAIRTALRDAATLSIGIAGLDTSRLVARVYDATGALTQTLFIQTGIEELTHQVLLCCGRSASTRATLH
jgi:hypothetical protein